MLLPEGTHHAGKDAGAEEFPAADGDLAGELLRLVPEVPFRLVRQGDQFLRPALEQHAGLRQDDVVVAPDKELDPELLLQLHDLAGQGGLCHMEHLRGPGDVFLPGDGQEVVQNAKFHRSHLLPP